jgi:lysozyme
MNVSENGIKFLERREALRLRAYLDEAGVPTIGYGSTRHLNGDKVALGDVIDENQAETLLRHDLATRVMFLNTNITVPTEQHEFDALISFAYNVGLAAFKTSTLLKKLNLGSGKKDIAAEFDRWIYITVDGKKQKSQGLTLRRAREKDLFLKGIYA